MGDSLGYARISTGDQEAAGQTLRLEQAGALTVFIDMCSGKATVRPGVEVLLAYARCGDTVAVIHLDGFGGLRGDLLAPAMLKERKHRPAQPGREDRHHLGRPDPQQTPGAAADQDGQDQGGTDAGRGGPVASRGRQTADGETLHPRTGHQHGRKPGANHSFLTSIRPDTDQSTIVVRLNSALLSRTNIATSSF